jgi:putative ABC transport system permease protein
MPEWKNEIRRRLAILKLTPTREAEIVDELAQHLDARYQELRDGGQTEEEALHATLAELNESDLLARELRRLERPAKFELGVPGVRTGRMFEGLLQDLGYGFRVLRKNRSFTAVAVLTLAIGIGANTAIFSAVNTLLLRPLPVEDSESLVFGLGLREGFDPFWTTLLEYGSYRERSQSFVNSGVAVQRPFNLIGRDEPERVQGAAVMPDYFDTLGVHPLAGRSFVAADDRPGGPALAIIGYGLWQRRFGGDQGIIGQPLDLEGQSYTVIGIMPAGFDLPVGSEIWVPRQINLSNIPLELQDIHNNEMVARLKPGVSIAQADAELKSIAAELEQEYPQFRRGWSYRLIPLRQILLGDIPGRIEKALYTLLAAVGFLLLICCANVANLILARGVSRQREIAIRTALGASRWRLTRQLLTESLILTLLGSSVGVLLAYWILPLLAAVSPIRVSALSTTLNQIQIDGRVLAFAVLISLITWLVFSLAPALKVAGADKLMLLIKQTEQRSGGSFTGRRWLGGLVIGQIAVAIVLLAGGALLIQSFQRLQRVELGFRPDQLLAIQMILSPSKYPQHHQRVSFIERVLQEVNKQPGVISAGTTTSIPFPTISFESRFTIEGRPPLDPGEVPSTGHRLVSPGYLEALGATLLTGRFITEHDRAGQLPVAVISEQLARQAWPGEDPLGKRVRAGLPHESNRPWLTVIGVVGDLTEDDFRQSRAAWYLPYYEYGQYTYQPAMMTTRVNLMVRASGDPASLSTAVRQAIRSVDPNQPVSEVTTMTEHLSRELAAERFSALLMGSLAVIGLLVSALGLYGVMSYSISRRTGELGLRMALGARPLDIFKLVYRQSAVLIVTGLGLGIVGAIVVTRFLAGSLYSVSPTDPLTFVGISVLLSAVALIACFFPARRATTVDPLTTLRHE